MRHPPPAIDPGVCYGATDLALAGPVHAALWADVPAVARLVTSPLTRCRALAEALGAARGLAPVIDDRLREMDFGAWEGVAWAAIERAELDAWAADFLHARPHGGESVAMLKARVDAALAEHRASAGPTLIVTHAGVIKAALGDWRAEVGFGAWLTLPQAGRLPSAEGSM